MGNDSNHSYEFGPFWLDTLERELRRDGEAIPLTPKAIDILLLMVENHGRVVTKDEFMRRVWPDAVVEESNLTDNISTLRQLLGDDAREPQYIKTVPKHGYRFIGEVVRRDAADEHGRRNPRTAIILAVAGSLIAIAITAYLLWNRDRGVAPAARAVAVLPFKPLVAEQGDPALELGMTDALISKLSAIPQIDVRPTTAVLKYRDRESDFRTVASELHVEVVLDGKLQKAGNRVRLSVQLIHAADGATLWAEQFDEPFTDLFAVQDAISRRAADALALRLSSAEREQISRRYTNDVEAYRLYLNGLYLWQTFDPKSLETSINYFKAAIRKDPKFALAWVGMARSYNQMGIREGPLAPREAFAKSREAVETALRIDPSLAQAHIPIAARKIFHEWDWDGAERELDLAARGTSDDSAVHALRAYVHAARGRKDDALREARRTYELAPTCHSAKEDLLWSLLGAGKHEEAMARARQAIALVPNDAGAHEVIGAVLISEHRYEEAIPPLEKAMELSRPSPAYVRGTLAAAYAGAGHHGKARELLEAAQRERDRQTPLHVARIYCVLGDRDAAFTWLDRAAEERCPILWEITWMPQFDPIRSDPRYAALMKRMNLAPP